MWWGCAANTSNMHKSRSRRSFIQAHAEGKQSSEMRAEKPAYVTSESEGRAGSWVRVKDQSSSAICQAGRRGVGSVSLLFCFKSSTSVNPNDFEFPPPCMNKKKKKTRIHLLLVGERRLPPRTTCLPSAQTPLSLPSASLSAFLLPRFSIHSHSRLLAHSLWQALLASESRACTQINTILCT